MWKTVIYLAFRAINVVGNVFLNGVIKEGMVGLPSS